MNPLDKHPKIREALLFVQWAVTGIMGILGVVFLAMAGGDVNQVPDWYAIALVATQFAWTYLGFTAQNNVTGTDAAGYPIEGVSRGESV